MSFHGNSFTDSTAPIRAILADLSKVQYDIDKLVLDIDRDARETLSDLGFAFDPKEWCSSAKRVINAVNKEHRIVARTEILLGSRRIIRLGGMKYVLEGIVEGKRASSRITSLLDQLQLICEDSHDKIPPHVNFQTSYYIIKFKEALKLVSDGIAAVIAHFNEYKVYFQVMDQPIYAVKDAIRGLYGVRPEKEKVEAARSMLTSLANFHESRHDLSVQATSLVTETGRFLHSNTSTSVPCPFLDEKMSVIRSIHKRLQEQCGPELAVREEFSTCIQIAAATPEAVFSPGFHAELSVSRLRTSDVEFKNIINRMRTIQEVYEPLETAIGLALERIRENVLALTASAS